MPSRDVPPHLVRSCGNKLPLILVAPLFLEFCRFARPCFGHGSPFGGLPRRARFCGGGSGFFLLR